MTSIPYRTAVRVLVRALIAALCGLSLFCANQMRPSGGPVDEDAPRVVRCDPAPESVTVSPKARIEFIFSEWIEPRTAQQSVTVFPPVSDGFKIVVNGRKLACVPKTDLAESTTYHVEISMTLKDLHGVSIGAPYHLVFSTGERLDSAAVWGCVIEPDKNKGQPKVAIFRHDSAGLNDTVLLSIPSYLAQTDTLNRFMLRNIRAGAYDILAFIDTDNNNRLGSGKEQAYAPVDRRIELADVVGPVVFFPVSCDSSAKKIASLKPVSPSMLLGQWESGTRLNDSALFDTAWTLENVDTTDTVPPPPAIIEYLGIKHTARFVLRLDREMGMGAYTLIYRPQSQITTDARADTLRDTLRFNGTTAPDTVAPEVVMWEPRSHTDLEPRILIAWSEPVRITRPIWHALDSLGDSVQLSADTAYADTTVLAPSRRLVAGMRYTLTIADSFFADLWGNHPSDTSDTPAVSIEFSTIAAGDFCSSLSGGSPCLEPSPERIWTFTPLGAKRSYQCADSAGQFRFESIPAASGRLSYLIDSNRDGEVTQGRLFPWEPPEPYFPLSDTVEARARWDVEGVTVLECDPCPKELPAPSDTAVVDSSEAKGQQKDSEGLNSKLEAGNSKQR